MNALGVTNSSISDDHLKAIVADILGCDTEAIQDDTVLATLGADYLFISEIILQAEEEMGWWPIYDEHEVFFTSETKTFRSFADTLNAAAQA